MKRQSLWRAPSWQSSARASHNASRYTGKHGSGDKDLFSIRSGSRKKRAGCLRILEQRHRCVFRTVTECCTDEWTYGRAQPSLRRYYLVLFTSFTYDDIFSKFQPRMDTPVAITAQTNQAITTTSWEISWPGLSTQHVPIKTRGPWPSWKVPHANVFRCVW